MMAENKRYAKSIDNSDIHVLERDNRSRTRETKRKIKSLADENKLRLYELFNSEANINIPEALSLIDRKAELNHSEEADGHRKIIHYATIQLQSKILEKVLQHLTIPQINAVTNEGRNALHLLFLEKKEIEKGFFDCMRYLVQNDINLNQLDNNGVPPIYFAAKNKCEQAIRKLLIEWKHKIDIDSYMDIENKSTREYMREMNIEVNARYIHIYATDIENLFRFVKESKEENFIKLAQLIKYKPNSSGTESHTLLQLACLNNLEKVVQHLINIGVDPNKTTKMYSISPLKIAILHNYSGIFGPLLSYKKTSIPSPEFIISQLFLSDDTILLQYYIKNKVEIQMKAKSDVVRELLENASGYSYVKPKHIMYLLNEGIYLGTHGTYLHLGIENVDIDVLKIYFDSCIKHDNDIIGKIGKIEKTTSFNFKNLIPAVPIKSNQDLEENKIVADLVPETEVILFISKSPELKDLLKHPLITSFITLKWHRIKWIFYGNCVFYISFCITLLLYTFNMYKNEYSSAPIYASTLLWITYIILIIREVIQCFILTKEYIFDIENWIEVALIFIVGYILNATASKGLYAVAILLAAAELLLLIGKSNTYIIMLRTVSVNFFKCLMWYFILIFAFACSLYILAFDNENALFNITNKRADAKYAKSHSFNDFATGLGFALFRTILMLTGELNSNEIQFIDEPILGHIILMAFVLIIAVILFNLLNGLAVSDTQEIRNNAELFGLIARVEYIHYMESLTCNKNGLRVFREGLIFIRNLNSTTLKIYHNKKGKIYKDMQADDVDKFENFHLDNRTVNTVKAIFKEKKKKTIEDDILQNIIETQKELLNKIKKIEGTLRIKS